MTWKEFVRKALTEEIRLREAQKNRFVPLSRWVALREAFVLHHLGVTGNMVSLFRIVLSVIALFLYARFIHGDLVSAALGIILMAWQINLDSVDGSLARAQGVASDFGNDLDNFGIDYARTCFWVLAGAMTSDIRMVILTVLTGHILVSFRQHYVGRSIGPFDNVIRSFTYIPVLWVLVPAVMVTLLALGLPALFIAYVVAWFYFILAVVWFLVCLWKNLL